MDLNEWQFARLNCIQNVDILQQFGYSFVDEKPPNIRLVTWRKLKNHSSVAVGTQSLVAFAIWLKQFSCVCIFEYLNLLLVITYWVQIWFKVHMRLYEVCELTQYTYNLGGCNFLKCYLAWIAGFHYVYGKGRRLSCSPHGSIIYKGKPTKHTTTCLLWCLCY